MGRMWLHLLHNIRWLFIIIKTNSLHPRLNTEVTPKFINGVSSSLHNIVNLSDTALPVAYEYVIRIS